MFAIAAAPDLVSLPRPKEAIVVDHATLLSDDRPPVQVSLPHVFRPGVAANPRSLRYVVAIEASALPAGDAALYIPVVNRRIILELDDEPFFDSAAHVVWMGPVLSNPVLVRLPQRALTGGSHHLTLLVEPGPFAGPAYLSRLYLGSEAELVTAFRWRHFLDVDLRTISLAVQVILGVGFVLAWLVRPRTALLSWLATLQALGIVEAIGVFVGFQPLFRPFLPYIVAFVPAWGLLTVIVSLALVGERPPRALLLIGVTITVSLLACAVIGTPLARIVAAATATVTMCVGVVAAVGVIAWGAVRRDSIDARIMLMPAALTAWFLVRDGYVVATLPEHAFRLDAPHAGLLYVAGLVAVLGRRMVYSFDQLDKSNETLNARLAEREAELAALARQERVEAARLVREKERGRLTGDLHDGISGHLVSIIALAERARTRPIEQAARDALNDLRLVIYSLDLGEGELPLALASFRERLEPQLHRLGVTLDWSMAGLPEVSGVTPGNALTVLRIVQEAITNALKHGPARRIAVRGGAAGSRATIVIENDGRPFAAGSPGHGLDNMRRRADRLGAELKFEMLEHGTRVAILLPRHLPDLGT